LSRQPSWTRSAGTAAASTSKRRSSVVNERGGSDDAIHQVGSPAAAAGISDQRRQTLRDALVTRVDNAEAKLGEGGDGHARGSRGRGAQGATLVRRR
jgi:hypothetical protein